MTSRVVSTYGLETRSGTRSSIGPSALSAAISSADTYWLDSPASISTRPPASLPPRTRTGAQPGRPSSSISAPSRRRAATRGPIGRSRSRGDPSRIHSPGVTAQLATSSRSSVPALRQSSRTASSVPSFGGGPTRSPDPETERRHQPIASSTARKAAMSSASRRFSIVADRRPISARFRARCEMLFEPGGSTTPETPAARRTGYGSGSESVSRATAVSDRETRRPRSAPHHLRRPTGGQRGSDRAAARRCLRPAGAPRTAE